MRESSLSLPPLTITNGEIIDDNENKTILFNDCFASQLKFLSPEREVPVCLPSDNILILDITNNDDVCSELKSLNVNNACGPDGIPNKILGTIVIFLKEPLAKLFNVIG